MLKLVVLLILATETVYSDVFSCPAEKISSNPIQGTLPPAVTTMTLIPKGTDCTFSFDIPNNYALVLTFSVDFQHDNDSIYVIDSLNQARSVRHTGSIISNRKLWMPSNNAQVRVIGVSGDSSFMVNYLYQSLNDYVQVKKSTGDYFALSLISAKDYYTITASSAAEKVVLSYAQRFGASDDSLLQQYFVYDGDNINTAKMIGSLADLGANISLSSGKSVSIVNFYGDPSLSYVLGNDASTLTNCNKYHVFMTSSGTTASGNMTDLSGQLGCYTFICTNCNNFYYTTLSFDHSATYSNAGYVTFQGQTPTDRMEKLIRYDPMTLDDTYLPQLFPTNILTINLHLSKMPFVLKTRDDDSLWKKPFDQRKGYIFSPNLWMPTLSTFSQEFRDDSQLYNFSLSVDKMTFGTNKDQLTIKIGSGSGDPALNNVYSQSKTEKSINSRGNYMQLSLSGANDDVRLRFEMNKTSSSTVISVLTAIMFTLFSVL